MRDAISRYYWGLVRRRTFVVLATIAVAAGLLWLIRVGYSYEWTGFNSYVNARGDTMRAKTLWDWLELLIVPTVLAVGALLFNRAERRAGRELADKRAQQDWDLASQRAREVALQSYLDKMTELLLENELRGSTRDSEVRVIARARTLTALSTLDRGRKALLLWFLIEAGLVTGGEAVIDLTGADLDGVDLFGAGFGRTNLSRTNLRGAILGQTDLTRATLRDANLLGADLRGADLSGADLSGADLSMADLTGANLLGVDLTKANLEQAKVTDQQLRGTELLAGTTMPDGTKHE